MGFMSFVDRDIQYNLLLDFLTTFDINLYRTNLILLNKLTETAAKYNR